MKILLPLIIACLLLISCSSVIQPTASGGSRADGVIQFSYSHGVFVRPRIDWGSVDQDAVSRCRAWNYQGASRFDAPTRQCIAQMPQAQPVGNAGQQRYTLEPAQFPGGAQCSAYQYTVTYQCTGSN